MLPGLPPGSALRDGRAAQVLAGRPDSSSNGHRYWPFSIAMAAAPLLNAACGSPQE